MLVVFPYIFVADTKIIHDNFVLIKCADSNAQMF